jgi:hypothetical protein
MMQLKCTRKLLDFAGVTPAPLPESNGTLLGAWHVNTEVIGRYRFLLFLNDQSLYCLVAVIPATEKTVPLAIVFRHLLAAAMLKNGVDQAHIEQVGQEYVEEMITKTDSRKVRGNLNDMFNQTCYVIEDAMSKNRPVDLAEIENHLNRIPQKNIGWRFSVDVFKEMLGAS